MRSLKQGVAPPSAPGIGRTRGLGWLLDQWSDFKARLVADPRMQRFALSNPLTRMVARRKASQLFDLCAGFVYSQILAAAVELDLCGKLRGGPLSIGELTADSGLPPEAAERLIDAAVALDLLVKRADGRIGLGELGAALNANPGVAAMVHHHRSLYEDLRDPVALLRGEKVDVNLNSYWGYADSADPAALGDADVATYSDLMSATQQFIADEVLAAYPVGQHRRMLDVGGGDGTFALAVARAVPDLAITVFDLPAVARRAAARIADCGMEGRVSATGGSFKADALPEAADLVTVVRVLYDHDDRTALQLLGKIRKSILPGGRILIAEPLADAPGAKRVGDAYFGFYLLAMGPGRARRAGEIAEMLTAAGFSRPRAVATRVPLQTGVIIADA